MFCRDFSRLGSILTGQDLDPDIGSRTTFSFTPFEIWILLPSPPFQLSLRVDAKVLHLCRLPGPWPTALLRGVLRRALLGPSWPPGEIKATDGYEDSKDQFFTLFVDLCIIHQKEKEANEFCPPRTQRSFLLALWSNGTMAGRLVSSISTQPNNPVASVAGASLCVGSRHRDASLQLFGWALSWTLSKRNLSS